MLQKYWRGYRVRKVLFLYMNGLRNGCCLSSDFNPIELCMLWTAHFPQAVSLEVLCFSAETGDSLWDGI